MTPAELQSAYKLPSSTAGTGQTVAVVDAYNDPSAESDLGAYRSAYGLGPCTTANGCFSKVNQSGGTSYPPEEAGWEVEISLDVDMVSATCPRCHILLVEANSNSYSDLTASVNEASAFGATEISNSWAGSEFSEETSLDSAFNHPGIPITAASGDWGYDDHEPPFEASSPSYPAASPNVIAVGGTTLTAASNARGWSESVWARSGSGCSLYEPKPWFQTDAGCSHRTTNDVAAVSEDLSVYYGGSWLAVGGTSAATPIVAAVEALSVGAARSLGAAAFYESPASLFDVISGSDGSCAGSYLCTAGSGYDGPTGVGTPDGAFPSGASASAVNSVSPDQGPVAGGTKVTITGSGFLGTSAVDFGSRPATNLSVVSPTELVATSPAGSDSAGYADITVVTPFGTSAITANDQFGYGPKITGVSPTTGPVAGGTKVALTGTGFESDGGVAQVFAISPRAAMQSLEVHSDTELTFVTPATVAGTTTLEVTMNGVANQSVGVVAASLQTFQYGFPQPAVTSVSPGQGAVAGGTKVTITGFGLSGTSSVSFGSSPATNVEVLSGTQITATSPAGSDSTGYRDVTAVSPGGTSPVTTADQFIYGPTIAAISPTSGSAAGGTTVTVTGTGFDSDGGVNKVEMSVGGPIATPTVRSDTELTFVTPPSSPTTARATATVELRTPGLNGQAESGDAPAPVLFTYLPVPAITDVVWPPSYNAEGSITGGSPVRITGSGLSGATAVDFGSVPASHFTVVSDTELTATSPPGSASSGWVDVTVVSPEGRSATTEHDQWVYVPAITGISPTSGPVRGGTPITITGTGFECDGGVYYVLTGTEHFLTSLSVVSNTTLTGVVAPSSYTGAVVVVVVMNGTPGQRSDIMPLTSAPERFTYTSNSAPSVSSIAPSSGPVAGGTQVKLTGTGFTGATAVDFGATPASSFTVNSETAITAVAPAGANGTIDVTVTTTMGTSATSSADHFSYLYMPAVSSVSPAQGPVAGGTPVTIGGSDLAGATQVYFGSKPAKSFIVNSSSVITAVSPTGSDAAGWVNVTVVAPEGTSAASEHDQFVYLATISGLTPTSGPVSGGTPITITGTGFESDGGVEYVLTGTLHFVSSLKIVSDTTMTGVVAASAEAGRVVVLAVMRGTPGQSAPRLVASPQSFTYLAAPAVASIEPTSGAATGGTAVKVKGSGFVSPAKVTIGGEATAVEVVSGTEIKAKTSSHAAGPQEVVVSDQGGTTASGPAFTYTSAPTVTKLEPASGPAAGGTQVTITGANLTGASAVKFAGVSASAVKVESPSQAIATSPAGSGTVDVTVTTPGGTSAESSADHFTYTSAPTVLSAPPTVIGISPLSEPLASGGSTAVTSIASIGRSTISVRNGTALVKLDCTGAQICSGTLKLTAKRLTMKGNKKRTRTVSIGAVTFSIAAGKASIIQIRLNSTGRALLNSAQGHLSATLTIPESGPVLSQTRTETARLNLAKIKKT